MLPLGCLRLIRKLRMRTWQRTDSRPQQLQIFRHVVHLQVELVPNFSVHAGGLLGQLHIYLRVSDRNWRPCQITRNRASINASLSHTRRTDRFLHEYMLEELQKTQRNEKVKSLIAIEYAHLRTKIAQQLPHHATPFAKGCIQKLQRHQQSRHRISWKRKKPTSHFFQNERRKKHINDKRRKSFNT